MLNDPRIWGTHLKRSEVVMQSFLFVLVSPCSLLAIFFFFIRQYGNCIREGEFWGKAGPTYVFPTCLKEVVRELIDGNLRDYPDPEGAAVRSIILFGHATRFQEYDLKKVMGWV